MSEATVALPVDEVTLTEDRARVTRRGTFRLDAGSHRLRVDAVSPLVVDKTLCGIVTGARLDDVRVERRGVFHAEERSGEARVLEVEREGALERERLIVARVARIEAGLGLLAEAGKRTIEELHQDAAWSRTDPSGWRAQLESLRERERALREARLNARRELVEARSEVARITRRIEALWTPSDAVRASLVVDLTLEAESECAIEVAYMVPSACWRPAHRATREDDGLVRWEAEAAVWQRTGEDWGDAQLRFSTQRPSLGVEPPRLTSDLLAVQRKREVIAVERRDQAIETVGLGRAREVEVPGIDDGGEVQELVASARSRVPSDGRPHRVALFAFETEGKERLTCAPELVAAVLRASTQANLSPHPLLAGPVDLVRGGGLIGQTAILYVAPGERFELGWGPDPALRVHRELELVDTETTLVRGWHVETTRAVVKLSNLGDAARAVELVERVPVSELEKVKIEVDVSATTGGRAPDADGFVRWSVELPPRGRARVELVSTLKRHPDVVGL